MPSDVGHGVMGVRVAGRNWRIPFGGGLELPPKQAATYAHSLEYGIPEARTGFTARPHRTDETEIVNRVIRAYHEATRNAAAGSSITQRDMWSDLGDLLHGGLAKLLKDRDVAGVSNYLSMAHSREVTHGITQGHLATAGLKTDPGFARIVGGMAKDALVSLGEYLGVLRVECPEQASSWGENLYRDVDRIVRDVEAALGIPLAIRNGAGDHFGLALNDGGVVALRDVWAVYAAKRALEAGKVLGAPTNLSVCEIGGGAGGAAYYASLLGVRSYTIIDLPIINALQGYVLLMTLGPDRVRLYGEPTARSAVSVLPTWCFETENVRHDLLLNMDSFPEIHPSIVRRYLEVAKTRISAGFLSINQEAGAPQNTQRAQGCVHQAATDAGQYESVTRNRCWVRMGYVDEVFRLRQFH
jgi:hypothetical protein